MSELKFYRFVMLCLLTAASFFGVKSYGDYRVRQHIASQYLPVSVPAYSQDTDYLDTGIPPVRTRLSQATGVQYRIADTPVPVVDQRPNHGSQFDSPTVDPRTTMHPPALEAVSPPETGPVPQSLVYATPVNSWLPAGPPPSTIQPSNQSARLPTTRSSVLPKQLQPPLATHLPRPDSTTRSIPPESTTPAEVAEIIQIQRQLGGSQVAGILSDVDWGSRESPPVIADEVFRDTILQMHWESTPSSESPVKGAVASGTNGDLIDSNLDLRQMAQDLREIADGLRTFDLLRSGRYDRLADRLELMVE